MDDERTKTARLVAFHQSQIGILLRRKQGIFDDRPFKEKVHDIVREVAEFSLISGVSNIVRNEIKIKLIWIGCHIFLIGLTTFLIINNILNYLKYDVTTKVREINEIPMEFPVVTLCNMNLFQTNYSVAYLREIGRLYNYTDIFNSSESYNEYFPFYVTNNYSYAGYASVFANHLNQSELQEFSFSLDEMMTWCEFNLEFCYSSDFEWYFHPEYGNCYQFNKNPLDSKYVVQAGSAGGLMIELFVGVPKLLEMITYHNGLAVFIHTNKTTPLSVQPVMIATNQETSIVVFKVTTQKQPYPYSDCRELNTVKSNLIDLILNKDCIIQCYQQVLGENCSCYDLNFINYFNSANYCNVMNDWHYNCYLQTYQNVFSDGFIKNHCLPLCPLECASTQYYTTTSVDSYPTPYYEYQVYESGRVERVYTPSDFSQPLRNSLVYLNIYFDSLSYTEIVEEPSMEAITLISNIGGSIGLMLGISIATTIEFVELLARILMVYLRHQKRLRRVGQMSATLPNSLVMDNQQNMNTTSLYK